VSETAVWYTLLCKCDKVFCNIITILTLFCVIRGINLLFISESKAKIRGGITKKNSNRRFRAKNWRGQYNQSFDFQLNLGIELLKQRFGFLKQRFGFSSFNKPLTDLPQEKIVYYSFVLVRKKKQQQQINTGKIVDNP